jgi:hypothetical protein
MSPGFAFTFEGTKTRDLLTVGEPTVMTIIFELATPEAGLDCEALGAVLVVPLVPNLSSLKSVLVPGSARSVVSTVHCCVMISGWGWLVAKGRLRGMTR